MSVKVVCIKLPRGLRGIARLFFIRKKQEKPLTIH